MMLGENAKSTTSQAPLLAVHEIGNKTFATHPILSKQLQVYSAWRNQGDHLHRKLILRDYYPVDRGEHEIGECDVVDPQEQH